MAESTCIFCRIIAGEIPADIVHQNEDCVVFLDNSPLFHGHCLVCPRRHFDTLMDVPPAHLTPLFETAQRVARAVEAGLGAEGSFVAINNKVSQSVPHLHVHVIPRRRKDGMKGFFWPRRPYASDAEMKEIAASVRTAMENQAS
ncbi:MAG TPA: HIT family protein [Bryobacteraceae bacterium]|nr:HIT family protein [Bryobacteraceae bacterium]